MPVGIGGKNAAITEIVLKLYVAVIHHKYQHALKQLLNRFFKHTATEVIDRPEIRMVLSITLLTTRTK